MTKLKRTKKTLYQALATCCAHPREKRPDMERIILRKGTLWATDGHLAAWAPPPTYMGQLPDESAFGPDGYIGTADTVMPDVARVVPFTDVIATADLCAEQVATLITACMSLKAITERGKDALIHLDPATHCARAAKRFLSVSVDVSFTGGVCATTTVDATKLITILSMPAFMHGCTLELRGHSTPIVFRPTLETYQGWGAMLATWRTHE